MEMAISAVMVGASSQPQSKASETGFSDILTEVRSAAPQTAENTVNQPSYDAARDYQADAVSAQETEITAEIEETVMTELKNTVISMVSKANGGNAEENDRIISALLDILREQDLVDNNTYDSANSLLHSAIDFPEFFWYPVCCQGKEDDEDDGCTQDPS